MTDGAISTDSPANRPPPREVEGCRGVLKVYNDGTIWRFKEPSFRVAFNDDGSILWKDVVFDSAHDLQLRLSKPALGQHSYPITKLPNLYYIHGGGFCMGSKAWPNCHNYCFKLASELKAVVVSLYYRLASESRLPAAIEDSYAALKWLQVQATTEEQDP